jgi:uncharacterized protein (TIGR02145 family)
MSFLCKIGLHNWNGCKCDNCWKTIHIWDGLKCSKCENKRENLAFTDVRDGRVYRYEKFGKHFWMIENLAYKAKNDCYSYENNERNLLKFGYLYKWKKANSVCPRGWHLPNKKEVIQLMAATDKNTISGSNEGKQQVKIFNPLLGGIRLIDGKFNAINERSNFWTSAEVDNKMAYYFYYFSYPGVSNLCFDDGCEADKRYGYYIRCVKD